MKPHHGGGARDEEKRRGKWLLSCSPFLHLPWLALEPEVGMENMQVLGWGPIGCRLKLCHLCELSLNWAWGMGQPQGQKTFRRRCRGSSPRSTWG